MRLNKHILLVLAALVLVGCGAKKKVVSTPEPEVIEPAVPTWHTCLIQGARATISTDSDRQSSAITMQTVHDSMLVISVMPMLGMEMLRIEATPIEITAIDKIHGQYAKATYAQLNNKLTPALNWDILQQLCTAELPTGDERARLVYMFNGERIELIVDYTPRKLDVPVRVGHQRLDKYTQVDISRWL
ncbi:MAG: DUF4292 domain-containing protein [Paludibacteraceae bacterium]|nr:DUF4292 domain-containing protein [Paludibacteraceae bacterium]